MSAYLVRFSERRPNGRTKPMKVQRVGPAPQAEVWRWVAKLIEGSTPDVLERLIEVKVQAVDETAPAQVEGGPE